ncbi:hypothetical protein Tco_0110284 [Tanacetum coccineum]
MSDFEHSYYYHTLTEWEYSDMGPPGVDVPPSPDYVPGPEAPPSPIYIPYVPEPEYPEFMPPEDHVFPAEEQPLPAVVSPTADSPDIFQNRSRGEILRRTQPTILLT